MRFSVAVIGAALVMLSAVPDYVEASGYLGGYPVYQTDAAITPTPEPVAEVVEPRQLSERYPWLFPSVVVVATVLIGLFIASIVQEVRRRLPPPDPPA